MQRLRRLLSVDKKEITQVYAYALLNGLVNLSLPLGIQAIINLIELANRFFDTLTIQKGLPKILIDFSLAAFQIIAGLVVLSMYHSFFILFGVGLIALVYTILVFTGPQGLKTSLKESKYKYGVAHWLEEIARTKMSFKLIKDPEISLSKTSWYSSKK